MSPPFGRFAATLQNPSSAACRSCKLSGMLVVWKAEMKELFLRGFAELWLQTRWKDYRKETYSEVKLFLSLDVFYLS